MGAGKKDVSDSGRHICKDVLLGNPWRVLSSWCQQGRNEGGGSAPAKTRL